MSELPKPLGDDQAPTSQPSPRIDDPFSVIDWAARSVASAGWLRPAIALVIVAAVSSRVFSSPGIAVFATISLLITMVLFYVFSRLVAQEGGRDELPARILLWVSLAVFVGAVGVVASLVTVRRPVFLADLLGLRERSIIADNMDQAEVIKVLKQSGTLPDTMVVTADMYNSRNMMEAFIVNASAYYCPIYPENRNVCAGYRAAARTVAAAQPSEIGATLPTNGSGGTCDGLVVNRLGPSDPIIGIDVSRHNTATDFQRLADRGVSFVFIKATQGDAGIDTTFVRNWDAAGRAGLARGAYHVFTGEFSPREAANFSAALKRVAVGPCDLGAALDIGDIPRPREPVDTAKYLDSALAWLNVTHRWTRKKPLLYYGAGIEIAFRQFPEKMKALSVYPLWWAQYAPVSRRSDYVLWQYTDGFSGRSAPALAHDDVDQSVFSGGKAQFLDFLQRQ